MVSIDLVFRSIINFKDDSGKMTLTYDDLIKNFRSLQQFVPDSPSDPAYRTLYFFVLDFLKGCSSEEEQQVPSYEYIKEHFENIEGNEAVLAALTRIKGERPYEGHEYREKLKQYIEDQNIQRLDRIITNVSKIATTGLVEGQGKSQKKLEGVLDAISYFARESKDLQTNLTGIKLEGQIVSKEESDDVVKEYEKIKQDPTDSLGIYTGIDHIDRVCKGLKNTELMICAAYTAHGKTTFALNMAYRAIYEGWNTAFITLEMSYTEIRRMMYVLHTCNPLFKKICPGQSSLVGKLDLNNATYATFKEEEYYLFKAAAEDFANNNDYGKFYAWQPSKTITTVSDIEFKLRQVQQEFQADGRNLDFVVVDYISLLGLDKNERSTDHNQNLNTIIKSLKRLCLTFNGGAGIRMLSPHQVNRDGYKEAKKNEGTYDSTALSNAHEAERSADVIISTYLDQSLRQAGQIKICNLKNRRNPLFSPCLACINFPSRFIYDSGVTEDDPIDIITDLYEEK